MNSSNSATSNNLWQSVDKVSLMPLEPAVRDIALGLYGQVADLPIISPHGHVDPNLLVQNQRFESAADLFIYHNHYVTRLLHADGVSLDQVRAPGQGAAEQEKNSHAERAWKIFADRWKLYAGTASGYWFVRELRDVFGIETEFNSETAESIRQQIEQKLDSKEFLPRNLFTKFNIEVLATTDSPVDNLVDHDQLNSGLLSGRVAPTFRPDAHINPASTGWATRVSELIAACGQRLSHQGLVESLAQRREYFKNHGAFSVDIGAESAFTTILSEQEASKLFTLGIRGKLTSEQAATYLGHLIGEMIRLSCEDELVITLHVGVHRNHSSNTFTKFGPDTGHDIPIRAEFTKNLHPVLEKYGLHPNLNLILFSLDETTWSREIAPLAGFYPSVFVGAPWWFFDAPLAARRFREATVETAGFYRGSGFIDDTRAFLSIPARHDMSRRVDSAFLAELVAKEQITLSQAEQIVVDLVTEIPKRAFKL
jgi:glucuronate isomerase